MKQAHSMIQLLILNVKQSGNDRNVYVKPLVVKLKDLCMMVSRCKMLHKRTFRMQIDFLSSINEFLSYIVLSIGVLKERWHAHIAWITIIMKGSNVAISKRIREPILLGRSPSLPTR